MIMARAPHYEVPYLKVGVVGEYLVGKTTLLMSYESGAWPEYIPSEFGHEEREVRIGNETFNWSFVEGRQREDYDRMRPLGYPGTDVFAYCFNVADRLSFEKITTKWWPETEHHVPGTPVLLIGLKTDLRDDPEALVKYAAMGGAISPPEGQELATRMGFLGYMECSSRTREGLEAVFERLAVEALEARKKKDAIKKRRVGGCGLQ